MLIIRREQREAFRANLRRDFEERLVRHVAVHFPVRFKALGTERVRKRIQYGVEAARGYGLTIEQDVSRYVNLVFALGKNFDSAPGISWAGRILEDEHLSPSERINVLYREAHRYLRRHRTEKVNTFKRPAV